MESFKSSFLSRPIISLPFNSVVDSLKSGPSLGSDSKKRVEKFGLYMAAAEGASAVGALFELVTKSSGYFFLLFLILSAVVLGITPKNHKYRKQYGLYMILCFFFFLGGFIGPFISSMFFTDYKYAFTGFAASAFIYLVHHATLKYLKLNGVIYWQAAAAGSLIGNLIILFLISYVIEMSLFGRFLLFVFLAALTGFVLMEIQIIVSGNTDDMEWQCIECCIDFVAVHFRLVRDHSGPVGAKIKAITKEIETVVPKKAD